MTGRRKHQQAAARQQLEHDIAAGRLKPIPQRITRALDFHGLYGPEVDRALGGEEPMVDEWEEGTRSPTPEQIKLLAELTDFPLRFFYTPMPELTGTTFVCSRSGPQKGCERVPLQTPASAPTAQPPRGVAVTQRPAKGTPGFWCRIPRCPLRGRRQPAPTNQAADAGWYRHYLDFHYSPPTPAAPDWNAS
ncbi:hypothetical protein ACIBKY_03365 [Nonomuraea sp. NPDC050394]|uniref:hypothetical protein n=1 Tax=Nonomuraea sp. NPDC050394 TaxID=3364363 RepID=UPI00379BC901